METSYKLQAADVSRILDGAAKHAQENNLHVTIAVVDAGGYLLGLRSLDGSARITSLIAPEKARLAAIADKASGAFEDGINNGRDALLSASVPGMMRGGVPIVYKGCVVGGVGVSGAKPEDDEKASEAGIEWLKNNK